MNKKAQKTKLKSLKQNGTLNPRPDKVNDVKFIDHEFFDPNDLLQVKYEMIRKVEQNETSVSEATSSFGFSRPSFYRLQEAFQKEGLVGLISKKKGPKEAHKLSGILASPVSKSAFICRDILFKFSAIFFIKGIFIVRVFVMSKRGLKK